MDVKIKNYKTLGRFIIEDAEYINYTLEDYENHFKISFINKRIDFNPYFLKVALPRYIKSAYIDAARKTLIVELFDNIDAKVLKISSDSITASFKKKDEGWDFVRRSDISDRDFDLSEMGSFHDKYKDILRPRKAPTKPVEASNLDLKINFDVDSNISTGIEFGFDWKSKVNLALFSYADYHWVVFDKYNHVDLKQFDNFFDQGLLEVKQLHNEEATILKFKFEKKLYPLVFKYNNYYKIAFVKKLRDNSYLKTQILNTNVWGRNYFIKLRGLGDIIKFYDPDTNDFLIVVPYEVPLSGVKTAYNTRNFRIGQSYQGVFCSQLTEKADIYPINKNGEKGVIFFSLK
jgi:hypothetical protein